MTRRRIALVSFALGLVALGVTGLSGACSLLTNPEQGTLKCKIEGDSKGATDPCPGNELVCFEGECKTIACVEHEACGNEVDDDCDGIIDEYQEDVAEVCGNSKDDDCDGETDEPIKQEEKCDGEDNDCDGETDEGHDVDGDGATWCGGGQMEKRDCEDNIAEAKPGGKESCDGIDNDCDGKTDEVESGTMLCTVPGTTCVGGRCVKPSCAIPGSGVNCKPGEKCVNDICMPQTNCAVACLTTEYCDQMSLTCKPLPQSHNGEPCSADGDCVLGSTCIDKAALGVQNTSSLRGVCGKACCSDAHCGADETCFVSATGARSCIKKTTASNAPHKACIAPGDCGQQVCGVDEMTFGSIKFGGTRCRTPASGERSYRDTCSSNPCNTRLCVSVPTWLLGVPDRCSRPCGVTAECSDLDRDQPGDVVKAYCEYVEVDDYIPALKGFAPICRLVRRESKGDRPPGDPCSFTNQCADGVCVGATAEGTGTCAPTCCHDTHCGANSRCLPTPRGTGRVEMRCVPK